jgi:hypothetical protein
MILGDHISLNLLNLDLKFIFSIRPVLSSSSTFAKCNKRGGWFFHSKGSNRRICLGGGNPIKNLAVSGNGCSEATRSNSSPSTGTAI